MHRMGASALLTAALLVSGCGDAPGTPEEQIRAWVAQIERASRERDVGVLKDAISGQYRDPAGRTQDDIHGLLVYHHFRQKTVYLLTRIEELDVLAPDRASLTLLAAIAGSPATRFEALSDLRGDLYRFELELAAQDGIWQVTSATWGPAPLLPQ